MRRSGQDPDDSRSWMHSTSDGDRQWWLCQDALEDYGIRWDSEIEIDRFNWAFTQRGFWWVWRCLFAFDIPGRCCFPTKQRTRLWSNLLDGILFLHVEWFTSLLSSWRWGIEPETFGCSTRAWKHSSGVILGKLKASSGICLQNLPFFWKWSMAQYGCM